MIAFDCPNCGNHLKVGDEFAGREGWCRQCGTILIVPESSGLPPRGVDPKARSAVIERLFRHAVTRAETFRAMAQEVRGAFADLDDFHARFDELSRRFEQFRADRDSESAARASVAIGVNEFRDAQAALADEVAGLSDRIAGLESGLRDNAASLERMAGDVGAHTADLGSIKGQIGEILQTMRGQLDKFARGESRLSELRDRVEQMEAESRLAANAARNGSDTAAEELALLRAELDAEREARARMERLLDETAARVAQLDGARMSVPVAADAYAGPARQGLASKGEGDADMGQQAILGAFLRFMEQAPQEQPPGA